jgi:hypothetical protein
MRQARRPKNQAARRVANSPIANRLGFLIRPRLVALALGRLGKTELQVRTLMGEGDWVERRITERGMPGHETYIQSSGVMSRMVALAIVPGVELIRRRQAAMTLFTHAAQSTEGKSASAAKRRGPSAEDPPLAWG